MNTYFSAGQASCPALPRAVIIGAAIVDIPLSPLPANALEAGSWPLERIAMRVGGDAANEAVTLARLGCPTALISLVGRDPAGDFVLQTLRGAGVDVSGVAQRPGLDTGINIVAVREDGERSFITSRTGSLRRLALADILPALDALEARRGEAPERRVACLASLFVSPLLTLADTAALFDALRARGYTVCADTTRRKNGETLAEAGDALSRLDYFFPNLEEAALLTGADTPEGCADALLGAGVKRVAIKLGGQGCLIAERGYRRRVPAVPGVRCVDTTGAGDTFAAAFIAALLEGRPFPACARFANAAASLCVERVGATAGDWTREDAEARAGKESGE